MASEKALPTDPDLIGKKIYLRPAAPDDFASFQLWRLQSGIQTLSSRPMKFMTPAQAVEAAKKTPERYPDQERFAIVRKADNTLVGFVGVFDYNPLNRSVEMGVSIDPDERKKGHARAAVDLICEYYFRFRGINKVHAQTASFNTAAVKLLESAGFSRDGTLRDHYFQDGEFYEGYIYSRLSFESD